MTTTLSPAERSQVRRQQNVEERLQEYRNAAEEIRAAREGAIQARDFAIAAICDANTRALTVGTKLIEYQGRFQGDFDEWLAGYCSEWFSRASAYRWMAKVKDLRAALATDEPTLEEMKKALIASEILPASDGSGASASAAAAPCFRLKLDLAGPPPEKWDPSDRRDFLTRAKPVVDLYQRVLAAEKEAA